MAESRNIFLSRLEWLRIRLTALARRVTFGPLPPGADGWYVWRLSPRWPRHEYKVVEVADGTMIDTEVCDDWGGERVVEGKPYGEFKGPLLRR